ncbi:YaiI/YqxD family protein [Jannaschia sp. LMIT008]|uniref:YaiI/YqxD family protein n=1 Tax=Jannaschia maritima TaxID=3032585 RepID=UPI0028120DD2|nr:YaiI/YqxD family protein [Jannaschia sp. LMIT008]
MILVDADACPVKREVCEVAIRRNVQVILVAGQYLRVPDHPLIRFFAAGDGFDAADDAIAAVARPGALVLTADVPLMDRALKAGAACLDFRGREMTQANIGNVSATRDLMAELRPGIEGMTGGQGGGPPPFGPKDRAAFKNGLDRVLTRMGF